MTEFTSRDYENVDFRKEQKLYTKFYYDEISTAPCITWCTEYFYRRMPEGKYRLVEIDSWDDELYVHNEYASAKEFADDFRAGCYEDETCDDETLFDTVLSLCPEDIRKQEEELRSHFHNRTAALLKQALKDGDRELVKALLPDFAAMRERLYPAPHIPCISERECKRRRKMLREYYRSQESYEEVRPYCFSKTDGRSYCDSVVIHKDRIGFSHACRVGGSNSEVLLEETEKLRKMYPELDLGPERG